MEKGKIWRIIKSDSTGRGDRREVKWGAVQSGAMTAAKKKRSPHASSLEDDKNDNNDGSVKTMVHCNLLDWMAGGIIQAKPQYWSDIVTKGGVGDPHPHPHRQ